MKPIRTMYKGILFRSKLEAEWAKFFDYLNIPWIYEPEGYEFTDGTRYLPDFWLPNSKQWFEVKGIMNDKDLHKIKTLCRESGFDVVVGYPNGEFDMFDTFFIRQDSEAEVAHYTKSETYISWCSECEHYSFMNSIGSYACQCCGAYDGDHYIHWMMNGDSQYRGYNEFNWIEISRIDIKK